MFCIFQSLLIQIISWGILITKIRLEDQIADIESNIKK
jgi:hypothetical protein